MIIRSFGCGRGFWGVLLFDRRSLIGGDWVSLGKIFAVVGAFSRIFGGVFVGAEVVVVLVSVTVRRLRLVKGRYALVWTVVAGRTVALSRHLLVLATVRVG